MSNRNVLRVRNLVKRNHWMECIPFSTKWPNVIVQSVLHFQFCRVEENTNLFFAIPEKLKITGHFGSNDSFCSLDTQIFLLILYCLYRIVCKMKMQPTAALVRFGKWVKQEKTVISVDNVRHDEQLSQDVKHLFDAIFHTFSKILLKFGVAGQWAVDMEKSFGVNAIMYYQWVSFVGGIIILSKQIHSFECSWFSSIHFSMESATHHRIAGINRVVWRKGFNLLQFERMKEMCLTLLTCLHLTIIEFHMWPACVCSNVPSSIHVMLLWMPECHLLSAIHVDISHLELEYAPKSLALALASAKLWGRNNLHIALCSVRSIHALQ